MSIAKVGTGEYLLRWELPADPVTGKRRRRTERFKGSKAAAKEYYISRQRDFNDGIGVETRGLTVGRFAIQWLVDGKINIKPRTGDNYRHMLDGFIIPVLGHIPLEDLTALDVQRALRRWQQQPRGDGKSGTVSSRTVENAFRVLHMMLGQAMRWQLIARNVADLVERPKVTRAPAKWWSAEEARQFLGVANTHMHGVVYALALLTGLRKGELLGLRWADVQWKENSLSVRQVLSGKNGQGGFQDPKTQAGTRTIYVDDAVIVLLHAQKAAQARQRLLAGEGYQDHDLICATGSGRPLGPRNVSRDFYKLIERAGVPMIRFHDLRHTHASLLREQGADFRVIADRLGHTQVAFTAQIYTHARTDAQKDSTTSLSRSLLGPK